MRTMRVFWLFLAIGANGQQEPGATALITRLAQEAESFQALAPQVTAQETLLQKGFAAVPRPKGRFRPKLGAKPVELQVQNREIVSAYGYSVFQDSPTFLHEVREVISVDGRKFGTPEKARQTLKQAIQSRSDKLKKRMLENYFEQGLSVAPLDFGQLILLFSRSQIQNYEFEPEGENQIGNEPVFVFNYRQVKGTESLTIVEAGHALSKPLQGSVWFRKSDLKPLRVTLLVSWEQKIQAEESTAKREIRVEAAVDYTPTAFGLVLPRFVAQRQFVSDQLMAENSCTYTPFEKLE